MNERNVFSTLRLTETKKNFTPGKLENLFFFNFHIRGELKVCVDQCLGSCDIDCA